MLTMRSSSSIGLPKPTNAWIYLSGASHRPGEFSAEANYTAGLSYSAVRSHNFASWSPVNTLQLQTNGLTLTIRDTNPPSTNSFYRVLGQ